MTNAELKLELADYFLIQGRFKTGRGYVGMSRSQYPQLFLDYFHSLSAEDKAGMVDILICGAIKDETEFSRQEVASLLGRLAIDRQVEYLKPHQQKLENIFLDPANLELWANDEDSNGRNYFQTWRFALQLGCILKRIGSVEVDRGYKYLMAHAKFAHFQVALQGNWRIIVERGL